MARPDTRRALHVSARLHGTSIPTFGVQEKSLSDRESGISLCVSPINTIHSFANLWGYETDA
eukprot:4238862-Pyramimonas_sp.AAC.1